MCTQPLRRSRVRRGRVCVGRRRQQHPAHSADVAITHARPAILEMPACRVLARLRTPHDDFGIYQGYRRYAEIVAGRAPNAQDAGIFAT
ncbi:hypothetical protein CRM91_10095 [Burkholderia ambifaria]|nr:hypothetical protein CRM91_10095 [Burkholderia ambifaria]